MRLRINHVHLHVTSLERALAFYRDALGLVVKQQFGPGLAFLGDGRGMDLALMEDAAAEPLPSWFHLGSRVACAEDVRATRAELARLGHEVSDLEEHDAGYVTFMVRDPDGHGLEVYHDPALAEAGDEG